MKIHPELQLGTKCVSSIVIIKIYGYFIKHNTFCLYIYKACTVDVCVMLHNRARHPKLPSHLTARTSEMKTMMTVTFRMLMKRQEQQLGSEHDNESSMTSPLGDL